MRVGIVSFRYGHVEGGPSMCALNVADILALSGIQTEVITFNKSGKFLGGYIEHPRLRILNFKKTDVILELAAYDFLIFNTMGYSHDKGYGPWYLEEILNSGLRLPPFLVQIQGESDRVLYPSHRKFMGHPNCAGVLVGESDYSNLPVFRMWVGQQQVYQTVQTKIDPDWSSEPYLADKSNLIISTSRWIQAKRTLEYARMIPELRGYGFEALSYGYQQIYPFAKLVYDVLEGLDIKKESFYRGTFTRSQLSAVYGKAKYHYGILYVGKKCDVVPRLEFPSVEAILYGCVPILETGSTPPYLDHLTSCISVHHTKLAWIPKILKELSPLDTSWLARNALVAIKNYYDNQKHSKKLRNLMEDIIKTAPPPVEPSSDPLIPTTPGVTDPNNVFQQNPGPVAPTTNVSDGEASLTEDSSDRKKWTAAQWEAYNSHTDPVHVDHVDALYSTHPDAWLLDWAEKNTPKYSKWAEFVKDVCPDARTFLEMGAGIGGGYRAVKKEFPNAYFVLTEAGAVPLDKIPPAPDIISKYVHNLFVDKPLLVKVDCLYHMGVLRCIAGRIPSPKVQGEYFASMLKPGGMVIYGDASRDDRFCTCLINSEDFVLMKTIRYGYKDGHGRNKTYQGFAYEYSPGWRQKV